MLLFLRIQKNSGGGRTEIIAQARAGIFQVAHGTYVGNGTTSVSITTGFTPKIIFVTTNMEDSYFGNSDWLTTYLSYASSYESTRVTSSSSLSYLIPYSFFWMSTMNNKMLINISSSGTSRYINISTTPNGFSLSLEGSETAGFVGNYNGATYSYIVFGDA